MTRPALLFDLDGTLIDSDPLHAAIFVEMFAERGRVIDEAFYAAEIHGRFNTEIFGAHFPDEDAHALHVEKEARFRAALGARVDATSGAKALIKKGKSHGWGIALVTNACRENAVAMLAATGLAGLFDVVIVGDEDTPCKPDPIPYREALRLLDADPARSLAFEDSATGITAAKGAGLTTLGLRSSHDDAALRAMGADASLADFNDPGLEPMLLTLTGETTP